MSLAPGTTLGPYEILAELGSGGMGEVYRATDTRLDREVAVKVLPDEVSDDPQALARFEREAKAIAALSHPNILAIYDVGRQQDVSFAVTELLEGETLRARLQGGALPPRKAVAYATQLAEGLAAAHERGITHRDVKPENVFITRDGRVKLLDFGLARTLETDEGVAEAETRLDATQPNTVLGTLGYMSPEQVRGERADARSDVFAFGVVLYEMLGGRRAFRGRSAAETMSAVLRDDPPALSRVGVAVPSRLERIVGRCLEKSPGERFQSARDLAFVLSTALDEVEKDETIAAAKLAELSVVVLPFANLSADPDDEFLADGFTEEAISDLSAIRSLKVISRTSAMRLKGADKDATMIAMELGVRYVLEGSVRRSGDTLRVTARLVDAETDVQLWSDRCSGVTSDIFSIQEQVARGIVDALSVRLTPQEDQALSVRQVTDPRAMKRICGPGRRSGYSVRNP